MRFKNPKEVNQKNIKISLKCPYCHKIGVFDLIGNPVQVSRNLESNNYYMGNFKCPNDECRSHVFAGYSDFHESVISYPPETISFDSLNIPDTIVETFEEAIKCHSHNSYIASAIMVRRTLEEICDDKDAKGSNLKQRIESLSELVILPPPLLKGLDNLRLMGNDAAHVEARDYKSIGKNEVELAIDVTKEVLKSVYQYENLVERLFQLKE